MSDTGNLNSCGCCQGIEPLTPANVANRPGLPAILFRAGTHAAFKETMLAAITRTTGLAALTTREDDDPAIAITDAWAVVLDVLTFYQERIANEGYLRTATERMSVLELVRAIGYELSPGVSATTWLAFELAKSGGGAPGTATIPVGAKAQSLPGPDEKPQVFETSEAIDARAEWNAIVPTPTQPQKIAVGTTTIFIEGVANNLKVGDPLLVIGSQWPSNPAVQRYDFPLIASLTNDAANNRTVVTLTHSLTFARGSAASPPPPEEIEVYAFRQRASVYGFNAPDWRTLPDTVRVLYPGGDLTVSGVEWPHFDLLAPSTSSAIDLNTTYPQILQGSYALLQSPASSFNVYQVPTTFEVARNSYTLAGKATRIFLNGANSLLNITNYPVRSTTVFAQGEKLKLASQPDARPVLGDVIEVPRLLSFPPKDRTVIVSGKRFRATINQGGFTLFSLDGSQSKPVNQGDELFFAGLPQFIWPSFVLWRMADRDGFEGLLLTTLSFGGLFTFEFPQASDPVVSEAATLKSVDGDPSVARLRFTASLHNLFERSSVTINLNVALATHGETKTEVLGQIDAAQAFQTFTLKNKPLTYVSAATATGAASTLAVRVNNVLWHEAPSFYGLGPRDRDYITRFADDGTVNVQFGDGVTGERPSSGAENVTALYRMGTGLAGMVKSGQISLLLTRPLGVKGVTNPLAPTGAADPETRDASRRNAPLKTLTLERVVSLQDFQDFARAFAGIGKAHADTIYDGETRLVLLTVAGANGGSVPPGTPLFDNLRTAILQGADPVQRCRLISFERLRFALQAKILPHPDYVFELVKSAAAAALAASFSFDSREFAQPVHASEVLSVIQGVEGVVAVDLDFLYLSGSTPKWNEVLVAGPGRRDGVNIRAAQLLTIDADAVTLLEMTS